MFNAERTYTAMEFRPNPEDCNEVSGTYLLKDEELDRDSEDEGLAKDAPIPTNHPPRSVRCVLGITLASVFVVGVAIAILVLVVTALTTPAPRDSSSSSVVTQSRVSRRPAVVPECGDVGNSVVCLGSENDGCRPMLVGSREDGIFVFKGIPYALPPVADSRWEPPVPLGTRCSAPFYARSFGSKCVQPGRDDGRLTGSEDCLFLNVWTPRLDPGADLHVMVYFHGGGLVSGSGHENGSVPTSDLVRSANMVFVTFNYRLNAFGFMAVKALERNGASGNYGFMDQILALRWVRENIREFGGNPDKMTVFGQGSGATSIYALLTSELAVNLFHKAWLASPSPKLDSLLPEAYKQNAKFLNDAGCGNGTLDGQLPCLKNLSAEKVLQALPWKLWTNLHFYRLPLKTEQSTVIAVVDGSVLKSSPVDAWKKRQFNDIPLLIGNTAQETDVYPMINRLVDWSTYEDYVRQLMLPFSHANVSEILTMYGRAVSPEHSIASMISDMRVICPADEMAKVAADAAAEPIFRYVSSFRADRKPAGASGIEKNFAYSGVDVDAFFDDEPEASFARNGFTDVMRGVVFGFVRNGSVDRWNAFPQSAYNLSSAVERIVPYFQSDRCNYWRTNSFFPTFTWMN